MFKKHTYLLFFLIVFACMSNINNNKPIWASDIEGMVFVKGGCYDMGDTFGDGDPDEKPVHNVCVDDFYMGKYEVTVVEFRKFIQETGYRTEAERGDGCFYFDGKKASKDKSISWRNPGFSQTEKHPVVCVSWNDAIEYTNWKSKKAGMNFRLPTEAEWEYAARSGGKNYKYSWGNGSPSGNIADETAKRQFSNFKIWSGYDDGYVYTAPVGSFKANDLGLYDMTGNAWEWLSDWYGEDYYKQSPKNNPKGPPDGKYILLRGGSWGDDPRYLRAANRSGVEPGGRYVNLGFRLALSSSAR
ncbi:MAG: formylglycine-generating enzyme family protein [Nitrospirota bacterium]